MSGMENSVLAFLAAVGIAALIWLVAGLLLRGRRTETPAVLMLSVCGNAEALEGWVRTLHEVRTQLGRSAAIAIVDCGLTGLGLERAIRLRDRYSWVAYCPEPALTDYIDLLKDTI